MPWYAAHVVMAFRLTRHPQTEWHAFENVFLIEADSSKDAHAKARQRGLEDESHDDSLTLRGRPAVLEFAGIRKIVACFSEDERPGDGTEVTYTELEFSSREQLDRFLDGKEANVLVSDVLDDDPEPASGDE